MLVYGDTQEVLCPQAALDAIEAALDRLNAGPRGLAWHEAAVDLFIRMSGLAQCFADWEAAALGHDELTDGQTLLSDVLRRFAIHIDRSWRSGLVDQPSVDLAVQTPAGSASIDPPPPGGGVAKGDGGGGSPTLVRESSPSVMLRMPPPPGGGGLLETVSLEAKFADVRRLPWPATVTVKRCEGYAFYALYPETYLEAARALPCDSIVIGLRSIGAGLAALVAAAAGARTIVTLRPTGHPFARVINAGPRLIDMIRAGSHRRFVIVDEGPGLSGSSFGGTADWLEGMGVPRASITFMPSHAGEPGGLASASHRRRWDEVDKRVHSFEDVLGSSGAGLPVHDWFRDITGPLTQGPADLSGGQWASARFPTSPGREARKYLLTSGAGRFIARFAGIDAAARAKLDRARALHEAGFGVEPLAMRYGFTLEPFVAGLPTREVPVAWLISYLRFRRERFLAPRAGASLVELLAMATHNLAQIAPDAAVSLAERWIPERAAALQPAVAPVHVDARLHWWEWLEADGRIVKTDAVDHSQAHDLVGCQDILWDVAGAIVELPGAAANRHALAAAFTAGDPARLELLELIGFCYLAFQLGWWSMSGTAAGSAQSAGYGRQLIEAVRSPPWA